MWSGLGSIFLQSWKDALRIGYSDNVAMWVDEMPCRKGVWKLITLWVRVTSDMPFLIVVATCLIIVQFDARKMSRQQAAYCCRWDLCSWPAVCSQYSIGLGPTSFCNILRMSVIDVDLNVVYWSVLHLTLDSTWVWYSLLLELKIPTLARHWDFLLCLRHWEVYSLQVMRTYSWKLLEKSLT